MRPFPFQKLAEPTLEEMEASNSVGHEVVAISASNDSERMFLKLLCRNGDESVVWLDAFMVDQLSRQFEKALMGAERDPSTPIRTAFTGMEISSVGTIPPSLYRDRDGEED